MRTSMETAEGDTWERFLASLRGLTEQLGHPGVQRIVSEGPGGAGSIQPKTRERWVRSSCVPSLSSWSPRG